MICWKPEPEILSVPEVVPPGGGAWISAGDTPEMVGGAVQVAGGLAASSPPVVTEGLVGVLDRVQEPAATSDETRASRQSRFMGRLQAGGPPAAALRRQ
jgi:hypothetical protein